MINDLIDGISIKLDKAFGDSYKVYSEGVEQGLKEPCFFIAVLNPSENNMLGKRRFRQNPFDIHYFPSVMNDNAELQNMASNLYEHLEWITLINGDVIHGTQMRHEVIDGVLHFFVNYNTFTNKIVTPEDAMENFTVSSNVGE